MRRRGVCSPVQEGTYAESGKGRAARSGAGAALPNESAAQSERGEDVPADVAARLAAERLFARRRSDSVLTDECLLAAGEAEAYYKYLLLTEPQEGTVTSFKAGDVSYSTVGNAVERARQRRDLLAAQAGDLLRDPAEFVFRRV